jgi:hypothetical protein
MRRCRRLEQPFDGSVSTPTRNSPEAGSGKEGHRSGSAKFTRFGRQSFLGKRAVSNPSVISPEHTGWSAKHGSGNFGFRNGK